MGKFTISVAALIFAVALPATALQIEFRNIEEEPKDANYNFKVGNLTLDMRYNFGVGYDDNTNRASEGASREDGVKLINGLTLAIDWPLNPRFRIRSGSTIAYIFFPSGNGTDGFVVSGAGASLATELSFDFKVGDNGLLSLEERLSRSLDTIEIDRQDNARDYTLWDNAITLQYQTQLSSVMRTAINVQRLDRWADDSQFEFNDRTQHVLNWVTNWSVNSSLELGPFIRLVDTEYWEDLHNDGSEWELGLVANYRVTENSILSVAASYQDLDFDVDNNPAATEEDSGMAGSVTLATRMTESTVQQLQFTARRNIGSGTTVNYSEDLSAVYALQWAATDNWSVVGQFNWLRNNESSDVGEISDTYTAAIGSSYAFSQKTRIGLSYKYSEKRSNLPLRHYDRNEVSLQVNYDF